MAKETNTIKATIIPRNGTAASWTQHNPTLLAGELGVETDTGKFKFGNGVNAWNQLPYSGGDSSSSSGSGSTTPKPVKASIFGYDYLDDIGSSRGMKTIMATKRLATAICMCIIGQIKMPSD